MSASEFLRQRFAARRGQIFIPIQALGLILNEALPDNPFAAPVASPATAPSLARPTAGEAGPIASPAFSDP